ncbi:hypothetical protein [Marinicellulosiphila megalodicopiae]|uniref:Ppx/GppA phosphatase family protein n=1 Tax=Marinicellulosiphila megalodicopiae TaxID=2724896 RepID=UPI003BAF06C3
MDHIEHFAAVDLGSNSFHLIVVAKYANGKLTQVAANRELVQLSASTDLSTGDIPLATQARALRCLSSFYQTLSEFPGVKVRIVGTSAFRHIQQNKAFLAKAEAVLEHPIEILAGEEEAKLIYRGVSTLRESVPRFVMDVGGGSTEFIMGTGMQHEQVASLEIGCVSIKKDYFPDEKITQDQLDAAEAAVFEQLQPVAQRFGKTHWRQTLATSGSIKTISWALSNLNLIQNGVITAKALDRLRPIFVQTETLHNLSQLVGLNSRRADLLISGFVIVHQAFKAFELDSIVISNQAIREGIIDELINS